jgi:hypothetical protein
MKRTLFVLAAALFAASPALAQVPQLGGAPAVPQVRVRGTITDFANNVLTVGTVNGPVTVNLTPNAIIRAETKVNLADIKSGSYIGCTAVPLNDGSLKAIEVHVFPPAQAAAKPGQGSRGWDLYAKSSMTNGTVSNIDDVSVSGNNNRVLTVTYDGGQKRIIVPEGTPVVMAVNADKSALIPGQRVVILAASQGEKGLTAANVTVGRNGVDPPM